MKRLSVICFFILAVASVYAQKEKVPYDFIVRHTGDTIYGKIGVDLIDTTGNDHQILPANVKAFTIFYPSSEFKTAHTTYLPSNWINLKREFYEVLYKDSGPVSLLRMSPGRFNNGNTAGGQSYFVSGSGGAFVAGGDPTAQGPDIYYFEKKTILTGFKKNEFYDAAKDYFSDCKAIMDLIENVPNPKNPTKTHRAKIDDAGLLVGMYNQYLRSK